MGKKHKFGLADNEVIIATNNPNIDESVDDYVIIDLSQVDLADNAAARTRAMSAYPTTINTNIWVGIKWVDSYGLVAINWYDVAFGVWPPSPNYTESKGGSGSGIIPSPGGGYSGQDVISFDVSSINSVNSTSAAKSQVNSVVDFTNYDEGIWVGIRWNKSNQRKYSVGTGNGGATIKDVYTRVYTDWYELSAAKALIFKKTDVSTYVGT